MSKETQKANWSLIIDEWKQSGLSQKKYCNEKGINFNTFHYHKKKLPDEQNLVELPVIPIHENQQISIHFKSENIELRLPNNFNKQTLSNLFDLLGVAHVS